MFAEDRLAHLFLVLCKHDVIMQVMSSDDEDGKPVEHVVNSDDEDETADQEAASSGEENEKAEEMIDAKLKKWALTFEDIDEDEGEVACSNLSPAAKYCADNTVPPKLRKKVTRMVMCLYVLFFLQI